MPELLVLISLMCVLGLALWNNLRLSAILTRLEALGTPDEPDGSDNFSDVEEVQEDAHADEPAFSEDSDLPSLEEEEQWAKERATTRPNDALTDYELARLEREVEFDARIERMKWEMAKNQPVRINTNEEAPIFHPMVQNLPHDAVPIDFDDLPDVEITF